MKWQDQIYVDTTLQFGLHSVPKIFNAVVDGLAWVLQSEGVRLILHYLVDFLVLGPPDTDECAQALATTLRICDELSVPIAAETFY